VSPDALALADFYLGWTLPVRSVTRPVGFMSGRSAGWPLGVRAELTAVLAFVGVRVAVAGEAGDFRLLGVFFGL
jgi:hypothetical protein